MLELDEIIGKYTGGKNPFKQFLNGIFNAGKINLNKLIEKQPEEIEKDIYTGISETDDDTVVSYKFKLVKKSDGNESKLKSDFREPLVKMFNGNESKFKYNNIEDLTNGALKLDDYHKLLKNVQVGKIEWDELDSGYKLDLGQIRIHISEVVDGKKITIINKSKHAYVSYYLKENEDILYDSKNFDDKEFENKFKNKDNFKIENNFNAYIPFLLTITKDQIKYGSSDKKKPQKDSQTVCYNEPNKQ